MSTNNEFDLELNKLINYLKKFTQNQPDEILNDKKCYSSLLLIGKTLNTHLDFIDMDIFVQNRFDQVISNYLNEIFKISSSIDFQTKIDWEIAETATDRNEIIAQTFSYIIDITNEIVQGSIEFCLLFVENDGLYFFLEFLKDEVFLSKNEKVKILNTNPIDLPNYLTMIISNLANRTCDEQKHQWSSLNVAEILLNVAEINQSTQLNSYFTLAYLLDDEQIEKLFQQNKMNSILGEFFKLLNKASINFKENALNRLSTRINFKGKPIELEIHHVKRDEGILTSMIGILVRLYKLAVNDSIKLAIYFDGNIKECLRTILEKGNLIEIFYALELLAQLTFNLRIKQSINESKKFEKIFDTLMKKDLKKLVSDTDKLIYSNLRQVIEQIHWNLNIENRKISINQSSDKQSHIMISYDQSNRELCLKIKRELESMGHKVWINVSTFLGKTLESMANAIEKSFCVLICVNEKYRQSIDCQIEANYAIRLNKPIISLIMQTDYENQKGWLESVVSNQKNVNFMKYDFSVCLDKLKQEIDFFKGEENDLANKIDDEKEINSTKNEIENLTTSNQVINNDLRETNLNETDKMKIDLENISKSVDINQENIESAVDWKEERVNEFFVKNGLSLFIFEHFKPCTGKILKQLYDTKKVAPEFYFQPMSKIENVEFKNIVAFGACLDDLFSKNT